jgi:hypothetical protein
MRDYEDHDYEMDQPRRRRGRAYCRDRMCGAEDCIRCHPEGYEEPDDDEDEATDDPDAAGREEE